MSWQWVVLIAVILAALSSMLWALAWMQVRTAQATAKTQLTILNEPTNLPPVGKSP